MRRRREEERLRDAERFEVRVRREVLLKLRERKHDRLSMAKYLESVIERAVGLGDVSGFGTGRNRRCPCGSGRKARRCCEVEELEEVAA